MKLDADSLRCAAGNLEVLGWQVLLGSWRPDANLFIVSVDSTPFDHYRLSPDFPYKENQWGSVWRDGSGGKVLAVQTGGLGLTFSMHIN